MKKLNLLLLATVLGFSTIKAQFVSQKDSLDGNNINMLMYSNGILCMDTAKNAGRFIAPKGTGMSSIFAMSIQVVGINKTSGDTSLYAPSFIFNGDQYSEGPVADNYDATWKSKFGRMWKVSRADIEFHKQNWNVMGYIIPSNIQTWPAHGDITNGEAFNLAPYVDFNVDGKYTPQYGDYPCIKGDQAMYVISNDHRPNPKKELTVPFPLEVHLMAYQYATSNALNNTVFLEYKIVNRSNENFENVYLGVWQDYDVGCANDDYVGCDSSLNAFYGYNGDSLDEDCNGALGYGANIPFIGAVFLNHRMNHFISYERGRNPVTGSPEGLGNFYNYLMGKWKNGDPLMYGGKGHVSDTNATSTPANYMFSGDPRSQTDWNETNSSNIPFDRTGLGSSGPYTLNAGETIDMDLALVFTRDASKSRLDVFDSFKADVNFVQDFYDNRLGYCPNWVTGVASIEEATDLFEVYPNPAKDELNIKLGRATSQTDIILYDAQGRVVVEVNNVRAMITTLNVSSLQKGLYFLQLRERGQDSRVKKVVIR